MDIISEDSDLDPLLVSILSFLPEEMLPEINKLILYNDLSLINPRIYYSTHTNNTSQYHQYYERIYRSPNNKSSNNKPSCILPPGITEALTYKGPYGHVPGGRNDFYINFNRIIDQNEHGVDDYAKELFWKSQGPDHDQFGISLIKMHTRPSGENFHPQITVEYNLTPNKRYKTEFIFHMLKSFNLTAHYHEINGKWVEAKVEPGLNKCVTFDLPTNATGFGLSISPKSEDFYEQLDIISITISFVEGNIK